MSKKRLMKGSCMFNLPIKIWSRGHSIKCALRGKVEVRYWKPNTIHDEIAEFCTGCRLLEATK